MLVSSYDINVEAGEQLILSSLCNTTGVTLRIDAIQPNGTQEGSNFITHTPNSNRTIASTALALVPGALMGARVIATAGTPAFGSVWVRLEIGRSIGGVLTAYRTLGMGFLNTNTPFSWPGPNCNFLPTDGPGHLRIIAASVPAAGADVSETCPTGARWNLVAFHAKLVTDANVANRFPRLTLDDGANLYAEHYVASTAQTANQTAFYQWGQGLSTQIGQLGYHGALDIGLRVGAGHRIKTLTTAIQVGDQYSQLFYEVLEWMTGD